MMKRYYLYSLITCLLFLTNIETFAVETPANDRENFDTFLIQFTNSAKFQLSRIKFPLKSAIVLVTEDGDTEKSFPFTQEKWPLLEEGAFNVERIENDEGRVYLSNFINCAQRRTIY